MSKIQKNEIEPLSIISNLFENSASGIIILDSDFKVVWINKTLEEYLGLKREKIIGKDNPPLVYKQIKNIFENAEEFSKTVIASYNNTYKENYKCHVLPEGEREERWLEYWSQPIETGHFDGGRIEYYTDITIRERTEQEIKLRNDELMILNSIAAAINQGSDLSEVMLLALTEVENWLGLTQSELWVLDIESNKLLPGVHIGLPNNFFYKIPSWELGVGLPGIVAKTESHLLIKDIQADSRFIRKAGKKHKLVSALGIPLKSQEKLVGVMNFFDSTPKRFSFDTINILLAVGKLIGVAIDRAKLFEGRNDAADALRAAHNELELRVKERTAELQNSEEKFRAIFENSIDAIGVSMAGIHLFVNQAYLNMFGFEDEKDVIGKPNIALIAQDEQERVHRFTQNRTQGIDQPIKYTTRGLKADGTEFFMEVSVSSYTLGNINYTVGIIHDITKRKENESKLMEAQKIAQLGHWELDLVNNTLYWSDEIYRIFDLEPQAFGTTYEAFLDTVHPDDKQYVDQTYTNSVKNKTTYDINHRLLLKDGTIKYVNEKCRTIYDQAGKPLSSLGTVQDITKQVLIEKTAKEQARLLDLIFEYSLDSIVLLDKDYNFIRVSETYAKATQKDSSEFPGHNHFDLYPSILKEEFDEVKAAKNIYSRTARPFIFPDHPEWGTSYWDLGLVPILDKMNEIELFLFTLKDVTEHKLAEDKLKASELLQNSILKLAPTGIISINQEQNIIFINQITTAIFGYKPEEVIGKPLSILLPDNIQDIHHNHVNDFSQEKDGFREMANTRRVTGTRKNGEVFPIEVSLSKIKSSSELIFTATIRDITERKKTEKTLQRQANDLEALYQASEILVQQLTPELVINSIPEIAVENFGMKMAWVELISEDDVIVHPASSLGFEDGYLDSVTITWGDKPTGQGPTGKSLRSKKTAVMNNIQTDPTYSPWRDAAIERGYFSSGAFPIIINDVLLGGLNVYSEEPNHFTDERISVLESFANQAAAALNKANLFEQLEISRTELKRLSARLVEAQETERQHLARELHDEIGQGLTAIKLTIGMCLRLADEDGHQASSLKETKNLVDDLISQVRNLSLDLRPSILDDAGLLHALLWHINQFSNRTDIEIDFTHTNMEEDLPPKIKTAVYRIVQEGLTNVARHSRTNLVEVTVKKEKELLTLVVEDHGVGFDLNVKPNKQTGGILGMRERVQLLDGQFTISSTPGSGTRIFCTIPLNQELLKEGLDE